MNFGIDKLYHFVAGFVIAALPTMFIDSHVGLLNAHEVGLFSAIAVGLLKEVKDEVTYGGFDVLDFAVTVVGGVVGSYGLLYVTAKSLTYE